MPWQNGGRHRVNKVQNTNQRQYRAEYAAHETVHIYHTVKRLAQDNFGKVVQSCVGICGIIFQPIFSDKQVFIIHIKYGFHSRLICGDHIPKQFFFWENVFHTHVYMQRSLQCPWNVHHGKHFICFACAVKLLYADLIARLVQAESTVVHHPQRRHIHTGSGFPLFHIQLAVQNLYILCRKIVQPIDINSMFLPHHIIAQVIRYCVWRSCKLL